MLTCTFQTPHPSIDGEPKGGLPLEFKKNSELLKIDQFEFFNRIWASFWLGIQRGEGVTDGTNGKNKI